MTDERELDTAEPKSMDLKRAAVRGSFWVTVGFVGTIVIRLASSVVLTRFIHPEIYGLMDLVMTILVAIHLFSDIGLGPCIIQSPRGEEKRFLHTVWTMQIVRNVILLGVAMLVALPVSAIYHRTVLTWLIPAVGICNLLDTFYSPGMFLLNRRLKRGPIVAIELIVSLVTMLGTVCAVYAWDPSGFKQVLAGKISSLPFNESLVWTIVIGSVSAKLVGVALTYVLSPGRWPRFDWEKETVKEVFGFGKWVFLSTIISFFASQSDRLLAPNLAGFEASGLYGRAATLVAIATGLVDNLSNSIVLPMIGRVREKGGDFASATARIGLFSKVVGGVLLTGLLTAGPSIVNLLYPAAYSEVGWILQCLAIVGWLQVNSSIAGALFLGMGSPKQMMLANLAKFLGLALAVYPAAHFARHVGWTPLTAVLLAFGFGEVCRYTLFVVMGVRMRVWRLGQDVMIAVSIALTSLVTIAIGSRTVSMVLDGVPRSKVQWLASVLIHGGLGSLLWAGIAAILWKLGILSFKLKSSPSPSDAAG